MRKIPTNEAKPIRLTPALSGRLKSWLTFEHQKSKSSRSGLDTTIRTCLRMYQGVPASGRWRPFSDAPFIEITIGAEKADAVVAQAQDLIFQVKPPVTVRSRKEQYDKAGEALQELTDWGVESGKWNFRNAVKTFLIDDVQLGTGIFYVPWKKTVRKTDVAEIVDFGPEMTCLAMEHFMLPAKSEGDIQKDQWITMVCPMSREEAKLAGSIQGWTIDDPNASMTSDDNIANDRKRLAGITADSPGFRDLAIGYTWANFDVDGKGVGSDVEIVWNMTTGNPMKLTWFKYDCRPFLMTSYQDRAHVAWGIGVLEMVAPYEEEETEIHNNRVWGMMMRNMMMFQGPEQAMPEVAELYHGKYIPTDSGPITVMPMGVPDRTPIQAESLTDSLASRRVGANELNAASRLGGRTPGITALSALQQANRRFTPAFDNMRYAVAGAVMQCLYRYQEQVRKGDKKDEKGNVIERNEVEVHLEEVLGVEKARLVIDLFKKDKLELHDALDVQLTASSVSVNREADRQNMVMLEGIWEKYAGFVATLAQMKANPQMAGGPELAEKGLAAANKLMTRILRTFDQISDVEGYLIEDLGDVPKGMPMPQELAQMMGAQNTMPQNGGAPPQQ